jgi:predicted alpha/beta hydrolase
MTATGQYNAMEPVDTEVVPAHAADGTRAEVLVVRPRGTVRRALLWVPAMGVPARHYMALAELLAMQGIAVAIHEWRGLGSSDQRAGRGTNWGYRELLSLDLPATLAAARQVLPDAQWWVGGHSLGGQLGSLFAGLHPETLRGVVLVASGAPYWRQYRWGWLLGGAFALAPAVAYLFGHFPGRLLGFGGNESRGVIADWARSGRTGLYTAQGMEQDLEQALAMQTGQVHAIRLRDDWYGPRASLDWLVGKMPRATQELTVLAPQDLHGQPADHFSWMKSPLPIAERIARWLQAVEMPARTTAGPGA